jgi:hypothetical protein
MYSTNDLVKMGRRRFLENLGKLGVSGATLQYITKDELSELTSDPQKEVPRLGVLEHTNHEEIVNESAPPQREPKFYTIPREKWIRVETAHSAARNLKKSIKKKIKNASEDGSQQTNPLLGLNFGVITKNDQKTVIVSYNTLLDWTEKGVSEPNVSLDWLKKNLASTVSGEVQFNGKTVSRELPVEINEQHVEQDDYNGKYRPVPAGVIIEDIADNSYGSTGPSAYDKDLDDWVHTTAGHVVDGSSGHDIHQPSFSVYDGNYIGDSDKALAVSDFDAATIQLSDDRADAIGGADADTFDWDIYGVLGWDTIRDNEDSSYALRNQGYKTGRNSGDIGPVNDNKTFWTSAERDGGDSGGPHFKVKYSQAGDGYKAYIAGIHAWGSGGTYTAGATYIGKVEEYFNLTV